MADLKPRLDSGEGVGQSWEDVFLATDSALESASTEDGTTATAVLVWNDRSGNLCLQVLCMQLWPASSAMLSLSNQ